MSYALCYWILMLLWLVFGGVSVFGGLSNPNVRWGGACLLLFLLFLLLGLRVFGSALHS